MFKQVRLNDAILKFYQRSQPIAFSNAETLYDDLVLLRDQILMYGDLSEAQTNYLNEFIEKFDGTLSNTVKSIFEKWLNDGFLVDFIRDLINDQSLKNESKLNRLVKDVVDYGASAGGNPSTNTSAILSAINDANQGDTVRVPSGTFDINDTIIVDKDINFILDGDLVYDGIRDRPAIHFVRPKKVNIILNGEVRDKGMYEWHGWENDDYVGVLVENAFRSRIVINVIRNFTVGLRCLASKGQSFGFFFNTFNIFQLIDNKIQFEVKMVDPNSWFNANIFNEVFFSYTQSNTLFQTANVDRYGIKQTYVNNIIPADTNIFKNIRFDIQSTMGGTYTAISLQRAWEWKFENYRSELVSNSNVKFAVLNCETNQIRGIKFEPQAEYYKERENINVELVNVANPNLDYLQIFQKTGQFGNTRMTNIIKETDFNTRYRSTTNDFHIIEGIYRSPLNIDTLNILNESSTDYATTTRILENGVKIGSSYPIVFYLKNIKQGDTIEIKVLKSVSEISPSIRVKPFINTSVVENNEIIENGLLKKSIVASNSYWDNVNKLMTQAVDREYLTFSINSNEVDDVMVYIYGEVKGIEINSNNEKLSVLRSISNKRNNSKKHYLKNIPTKKIDGGFLPNDIIFNDSEVVGVDIGWILMNVEDSLQWTSLGKY